MFLKNKNLQLISKNKLLFCKLLKLSQYPSQIYPDTLPREYLVTTFSIYVTAYWTLSISAGLECYALWPQVFINPDCGNILNMLRASSPHHHHQASHQDWPHYRHQLSDGQEQGDDLFFPLSQRPSMAEPASMNKYCCLYCISLGACRRPAAQSGHTRNGLPAESGEEGEPGLYLHLPGRERLERMSTGHTVISGAGVLHTFSTW